jgi:aminoglycoside phosphotransferase (APT) family kinase protein
MTVAGAGASRDVGLDAAAVAALERLVGAAPVAFEPRAGGYTRAITGRAILADGRTVFVKTAAPGCPPDDPLVVDLGLERDVLLAAAATPAAACVPAVLAATDDPVPFLVLEDLSSAVWPLPYPADLGSLVAALDALAAVPPPPTLTALVDEEGAAGSWWQIADDPAPFVALDLVEPAWLDRALPALVDAEARVRLGGEQLVHGDLWFANLCFAGRGPVIVDWGSAMRGNPVLDRATVAMDLVIGGRDPTVLGVADLSAWIAFLAGHLAREATRPLPAEVAAGSSLRADQAADARALLVALGALLDLAPPAHTPSR